GTVTESVDHPELAALGLRFFRRMACRGPGSVEFKRDECDGAWKPVELNPPLWQQHGFAAACGENFSVDSISRPHRTAGSRPSLPGRRSLGRRAPPSAAFLGPLSDGQPDPSGSGNGRSAAGAISRCSPLTTPAVHEARVLSRTEGLLTRGSGDRIPDWCTHHISWAAVDARAPPCERAAPEDVQRGRRALDQGAAPPGPNSARLERQQVQPVIAA